MKFKKRSRLDKGSIYCLRPTNKLLVTSKESGSLACIEMLSKEAVYFWFLGDHYQKRGECMRHEFLKIFREIEFQKTEEDAHDILSDYHDNGLIPANFTEDHSEYEDALLEVMATGQVPERILC